MKKNLKYQWGEIKKKKKKKAGEMKQMFQFFQT